MELTVEVLPNHSRGIQPDVRRCRWVRKVAVGRTLVVLRWRTRRRSDSEVGESADKGDKSSQGNLNHDQVSGFGCALKNR